MADQTVTSLQSAIASLEEADRIKRRRARDKMRTAVQAPISDQKRCVLYLVNKRERCSPWFYTEARARQALELMQAKYGARNCILWRD
jgi:hypothetical protein